ncbi:nucI [Symbiodinium necroappetens]|uniref:NucI protein n=1 Tax=Symbiodinium necroappetens TaxID=1628268 RepID=A0A813A5V4_9DINO|nr:nucI [Symbiodinium necroappetens]
MNLVLLLCQEVEEINKTGFVLLPATDRRARHIVTVLKPTPGSTIRVGCVGVGVGRASVVVLERGEVRLTGQLSLSATPSQPHVELLLAMPRPKVMMRLWSVLAQLGLRRIVLTNAWRVEKPYFSSQATDPSKYTPELPLDRVRKGFLGFTV